LNIFTTSECPVQAANLPDLYLYSLKSTAFVIRKNPPLETETPTWSSKNCKAFTEVERMVIEHSVEGTMYKTPTSLAEDKPGFFYVWGGTDYSRINEMVYQKFILGCLANSVDVQVINWEN